MHQLRISIVLWQRRIWCLQHIQKASVAAGSEVCCLRLWMKRMESWWKYGNKYQCDTSGFDSGLLKRKSKEEYLPISAIARKYIARGVTEELVIEYHRKGYSISSIAENTDVTIAKVMDVLSRLNEESDVEKSLEEIEINSSEWFLPQIIQHIGIIGRSERQIFQDKSCPL